MTIISKIIEVVNSGRPFTDIHLEQDEIPMIRGLDGWESIEDMMITSKDDLEPLLRAIDRDWDDTLKKHAINRPYNLHNWRLRLNVYHSKGGERISIAIRRQPMTPLTIDQTGLPTGARLMANVMRGLILVSGAAGAGKSTTLASIVDEINFNRKAHIITIEDPIEYVHVRKKSIVSQREVGVDVDSFLIGVEDAMRQCPDVILIGEIRDAATARAALLAAESGHLVMASVHANRATSTVQKMLGFFSEDEYRSKADALASTLVGIICQILLPRADRSGFVVAPELLLNHNQQFSKELSSPERLIATFEKQEDPHSISMQRTIREMFRTELISRETALKASIAMGQPNLLERVAVRPGR